MNTLEKLVSKKANVLTEMRAEHDRQHKASVRKSENVDWSKYEELESELQEVQKEITKEKEKLGYYDY